MSATADEVRAPIEGATGLVVANLVTLGFALWFDWPIATLMWPYLLQSLVIGGFAILRMLTAPRICTKGMTSNGRPVPATRAGRVSTAAFFAVHYGFFHFGYALFVAHDGGWPTGTDLWATLALVLVFAWGHANSYRGNRRVEDEVPVNLGTVMALPYLRIIPMHLTIVFGGVLAGGSTSAFALTLFVLLKTGADLGMHYAEHRVLRRG
ncbi:MAG: DUF6498-containing protein [Steroidobacteraceae bacterium]|nr:DUF6498-containing protein [Steroidobacteraceae bacterium]